MNKVLVTGASGFVGKHLVDALLKRGSKVIALGHSAQCLGREEHPLLQYRRANLISHAELEYAIEPVDVVFHCAGLSKDWGAKKDFFKVNVKGTETLKKCCEKIGVKRIVHVSSASVYFKYQDQFELKEDEVDSTWFVNNYAHSKYLAEKVLRECQEKMEVVTIRPRGIIGSGDKSIAPRIMSLLRKGFFPLPNMGRALIDLTTVDNVVRSILLAGEKEGINNQTFNITNGQPMAVVELIKIFIREGAFNAKLLPLPYRVAMSIAKLSEIFSTIVRSPQPLVTCYGMGLLSVSQTLDIKKSKELLGYLPDRNLQTIISQVAESSNIGISR